MICEKERVRSLLIDTVSLLCKNSIHYSASLRIEGLIGITIDNSDVILVHLNESSGNFSNIEKKSFSDKTVIDTISNKDNIETISKSEEIINETIKDILDDSKINDSLDEDNVNECIEIEDIQIKIEPVELDSPDDSSPINVHETINSQVPKIEASVGSDMVSKCHKRKSAPCDVMSNRLHKNIKHEYSDTQLDILKIDSNSEHSLPDSVSSHNDSWASKNSVEKFDWSSERHHSFPSILNEFYHNQMTDSDPMTNRFNSSFNSSNHSAFKCQYPNCDRAFSHSGNLWRHEVAIHGKKKKRTWKNQSRDSFSFMYSNDITDVEI